MLEGIKYRITKMRETIKSDQTEILDILGMKDTVVIKKK